MKRNRQTTKSPRRKGRILGSAALFLLLGVFFTACGGRGEGGVSSGSSSEISSAAGERDSAGSSAYLPSSDSALEETFEVLSLYLDPDESSCMRFYWHEAAVEVLRGDGSRVAYSFDDAGRILGLQTFDEEGRPESRQENVYDEKGQLTRLDTYDYDMDGNAFLNRMDYSYAYDEKGNLTEMAAYSGDGALVYREETEYNGQNQKTRHRIYDNGSQLFFEELFDDAGNLVTEIQYDEAGGESLRQDYEYKDGVRVKEIWKGEMGRRVIEYNAQGVEIGGKSISPEGLLEREANLESGENGEYTVQIRLYDEEQRLTETTSYTYDREGNCLSQITQNGAGLITYAAYSSYNERGDLAEMRLFSLGEGEQTWRERCSWEYDSRGSILKFTSRSEEGDLLYEEDYLYNEQGKLLKKTVYDKDTGETSVYEMQWIPGSRLQSLVCMQEFSFEP